MTSPDGRAGDRMTQQQWFDAFTGEPTGLHSPNRHTVRCSDGRWLGLQCELGHGHPGHHRGTATARDGSGHTIPVEWEAD